MTEALLQQTIVEIFKTFYQPLMIESSWNGINLQGLSKEQIGKLMTDFYKQGGVKGSSDLKVYLPNMKMIHIELKRPRRTGGQSKEQKEVQEQLEFIGHKYYLCNSIESFFEVINNNLDLEYRLNLIKAYKGKYTEEQLKQQYEIKDTLWV